MGDPHAFAPLRSLLLVCALVIGVVPVTAVTAAQPTAELEASGPAPEAGPRTRPAAALVGAGDVPDPQQPPAAGFVDEAARLSLTPPAGWRPAPVTSLNPVTDPGSPVYELARFQLSLGDPALYAQPIAVTRGLIQDAGAVLSIGLAREGSDLLDLVIDRSQLREELGVAGGFVLFDDETTYDGLVTYTRTYAARETDRRIVIAAVVPSGDWPQLRSAVLAAMASLRADQVGPNGPVASVPVAVVEPEPQVVAAAVEAVDPSAARRADILERARELVGLRYVWGGNSTSAGMDCSSYISWTWRVGRYTTDSIGSVSHFIGKDELRPGDIMNLPTWNDPARYGHVRMFAAWANEARSLVWVYEETPPRVMYRVIAYDARYQPMRLNGLGSGGVAPLVVAPPSAVEVAVPSYGPAAAPRHQAAPRPAAKPRPAAPKRPVVTKPKPTARPKPVVTPKPTAKPATAKPRATAKPIATARPAAAVRTATPTRPATPRPAATPRR